MDFRDTDRVEASDVATVELDKTAEAKAPEKKAGESTLKAKPAKLDAVGDSASVHAPRFAVATDKSRDALLTAFGKETLEDRYLLPGESYQDLFARVAAAYADDQDHAQRIYDYISRLWFMPATPVLSNGGTGRGLPISCYLNSVDDSLEGIVNTWNENVWLASPRRRHRHLLGQRARHRRACRPQRQDQRHHPLRPRDGQPHACHQPGLAAPRLGRLLSRHQPPGDRGISRNPQTVGRLQPQGLEPPPRRADHRRVHGSGARRHRIQPAQPQGPAACAARSMRAACSRSWSKRASPPASLTSSSSTR